MTSNVSNLPLLPTMLVGREGEIADLIDLLDDPACRLLTLVGLGGIGKTRLGIEVARRMWDSYPDGIYFVPLQPLQAADQIAPALTGIFGIQTAHHPRDQLLSYLRDKHLLLVLDNFEHLLSGIDLLTDILIASPRVKLLVTSREVLGLQQDWTREVRGLAYPKDANQKMTEDNSAVQLFIERARQQRGDLEVEAQYPHIVRICQLVEGMPLALELAAGWVKTLSCREIAEELQRGHDVLATRAQDVPARHRTMQGVFAHSWSLLDAEERAVLGGLSVFRGGCTREAAAQVAGASLENLAALVEKSLLRHDAMTGRYDLHELVRQYAEERLVESGNDRSRQDQHCVFFMTFFQSCDLDLKGQRQIAALNEIEADFENIRVAWSTAIYQRRVDLITSAAESLYLYCQIKGTLHEGVDLLQQALDKIADQTPEWGRVFIRSVGLRVQPYTVRQTPAEFENLKSKIEQALAIARHHDAQAEIAYCLFQRGRLERMLLNFADAITHFDESFACFRVLQDRHYMAIVLWEKAFCLVNVGDREAMLLTKQSVDLARSTGNPLQLADSLTRLAWIHLYHEGDSDVAHQLFEEALFNADKLEYRTGINLVLYHQGIMAVFSSQFSEATTLGQRVLDIGKRYNLENNMGVGHIVLGFAVIAQGDYREGKQHALEGFRLLKRTPPQQFFASVAVGLATGGLHDTQMARQYLYSALQIADRFNISGFRLLCLPCAAILLTNYRQPVRAVEMIALAFTHHKFPDGWLRKWPLMTSLCDDLEAELGAVAFAAAWERGALLDLLQVTRDLLRELSLGLDTSVDQANGALHDPLTRRELDVLALLAEGLTNARVAERLFLTVGTVKGYTSRIYGKLGVENRVQAVAKAHELGLIA